MPLVLQHPDSRSAQSYAELADGVVREVEAAEEAASAGGAGSPPRVTYDEERGGIVARFFDADSAPAHSAIRRAAPRHSYRGQSDARLEAGAAPTRPCLQLEFSRGIPGRLAALAVSALTPSRATLIHARRRVNVRDATPRAAAAAAAR